MGLWRRSCAARTSARVDAGLDPGVVDVWAVPLSLDAAQSHWARALLPSDEQPQLDDSPAVRGRAIRGAWLRLVLSRYADCPAPALEFRYGAYGKPRLATPTGLHFNMTSTHDRAFIAVASVPVGVDAEHEADVPQPTPPVPGDHDGGGDGAGFAERWTCFEALTKAVGCGAAMDRPPFAVSWAGGVPSLTQIQHDDPRAWTLRTERPGGGVVLSLAVRAADAGVRWHTADLGADHTHDHTHDHTGV